MYMIISIKLPHSAVCMIAAWKAWLYFFSLQTVSFIGDDAIPSAFLVSSRPFKAIYVPNSELAQKSRFVMMVHFLWIDALRHM